MKLIIECTEQTYSECKKISGLSVTASVIANGKPYDGADEWISVDEALPEPLISVIATDNNDVFVAWYNEGWNSSDSQFDEYTPIVAWRPIPRYAESVDV